MLYLAFNQCHQVAMRHPGFRPGWNVVLLNAIAMVVLSLLARNLAAGCSRSNAAITTEILRRILESMGHLF